MRLSDVLRSGENPKVGGRTLLFYCPACKECHCIYVDGDRTKGPQWVFDGNVDQPTFTPSVKVSGLIPSDDPDKFDDPKYDKPFICHFFVTNGYIVYCTDCTHEFSGKTIPMVKRWLKDEDQI